MDSDYILRSPRGPDLICGSLSDYQRYRARRVYSLGKVAKMKRLGLIRSVENEAGGISIVVEDFEGPVVPDPVDLEQGEDSYRAAEERGDLPW